MNRKGNKNRRTRFQSDEKGKAIPDAMVLASVDGERPQSVRFPFPRDSFDGVADEKGKFSFDRLPAGKYRLLVSTPGKVVEYVHGVETGKKSVKIVLRPGEPIRGRVIDANGKPVPGAWVNIENDRETVFGTMTDRDGRFVTGPLHPEQAYKVVVDPRGMGPKPNVGGAANTTIEGVKPGGAEITIRAK